MHELSGKIDRATKTLRVSSATMSELRDIMSGSKPKKIQAIKLLRNATGCGLREAKVSIEAEFQNGKDPEAMPIAPLVAVKSITVDMGRGDVILSLEEFHMMTLVNLQSLGLDEVRKLIQFHDEIIDCERRVFSMEPTDDE
tara:strand:- start:194 stop:616 length:423 start_codon:yes stop_codon:yes gene_type:complete